MHNPVPYPDAAALNSLSSWLQRLEQFVWLDGFWRGVMTAAFFFTILVLLVMLFRKN